MCLSQSRLGQENRSHCMFFRHTGFATGIRDLPDNWKSRGSNEGRKAVVEVRDTDTEENLV